MALYHDAATLLSDIEPRGSLKSSIYNASTIKPQNASRVYALVSQTSKRDTFLKEVIENADLLRHEVKLTPLLALLVCHDHFFAKSGIAAATKHPVRLAIERHKSRLQSEFTRARLKRKCGSVEALIAQLDKENSKKDRRHPRWVRLNTLVAADVADVLHSLSAAKEVNSLEEVLQDENKDLVYTTDKNVPNLYAFPSGSNLTRSIAYDKGQIILQDKASCFPAWLLLGGQHDDVIGDVIDGCAAPGNKTSHVAALLEELQLQSRVFACEKDGQRSKTLKTMTLKAKADRVEVLANQDFLALDPDDPRFSNVTHLLLDPSCSGSGILNRQDIPKLALPVDPRASNVDVTAVAIASSKKRKRMPDTVTERTPVPEITDEETPEKATFERLEKLSNLQTRIVEHAMKFPAAKRITYSTCSIHEQENEVVVSRLLNSEVAQTQGWEVLPRKDQVQGMRMWKHRGVNEAGIQDNTLDENQLDACIRCHPDDEEATMGFFVCAFTRDTSTPSLSLTNGHPKQSYTAHETNLDSNDEWNGFD